VTWLPGVRTRTFLVAIFVSFTLLASGARAAPVALGVFIPDLYEHPERLAAYGRQVGRQPVLVLSYKNWSVEPFYAPELEHVWHAGGVPMVSWEPETARGEGISLRDIVEGRYDRYIRKSAEAAAAWRRPVFLRFAEEMNGSWYPWGLGVDGNTARDFRMAWHHIYWIFRNHGAGNVRWVWSPNEDAGGGHPLAVLYPGDEFVDWVGIDGFCWGGTVGWPSFTDVFGSTYDRILKITSKPIMIAETGAGEEDGDKPEWIRSAFDRELPGFSHVRALAWIDHVVPPADFRVDSSAASLAAFRSAISSPRYGATRDELLATPKALPPGGAAPERPSGGFGEPSLHEGIRLKLHGTHLFLAIGVAVLAAIAVIATLLGVRHHRRARGTEPRRGVG
jgi:Glycosyl hydrolase family 26